MNREEIIALIMEQQKTLDKMTIDVSDPDHKYYKGMSAMVDFLLMRIEHG